MTDIVLRLISNWYDPEDQARREHRTSTARSHAIAVRRRSEVTGEKLAKVQQSYRDADGTLARKCSGQGR
jgi:hypothetical protein